jgi:hypothetical protein
MKAEAFNASFFVFAVQRSTRPNRENEKVEIVFETFCFSFFLFQILQKSIDLGKIYRFL